MFLAIILSVAVLDLFFWSWADRRLRPLRYARLWRTLLAIFMALQVAGYSGVIAQRLFRVVANFPAYVLAVIYIWHLLVLPATMVAIAVLTGVGKVASLARTRPAAVPVLASGESEPADPPAEVAARAVPASDGPTRRQMVLAGLTALPPLLCAGSVATAMSQLGDFRVRKLEMLIADLPAPLDGMTIAQVSDTHVGRFTYGAKLRAIAEVTNSLKADLIILSGDLIDYSLSDLPAALEMVSKIDPRQGMYLCQGNHDMFQSRALFDERVRAAGYKLLINESAFVTVRGVPIQILGLKWGEHEDGRDAGVYTLVPDLLQQRQPDCFPILMAHHPHAFDPAAAAGIPLTLAGHTHGGQLMLTKDIGPGPLFYRYWSGPYYKGRSACVVSNGVGNWFPLRVNAPAEIVHITLRARGNG